MEDDDDDRKPRRRSCGRQCEQARRLMRVSTLTLPEDAVYDVVYDNGDSGEKPKKHKLRPKLLANKTPDDSDNTCQDDYMLRNLHRLKCFLKRTWDYAWCYTQYCYPGLRTTEYYKKVKRVCAERERVKKNREKEKEKKKKEAEKKKKNKKSDDTKNTGGKHPEIEPVLMSTAASTMFTDSSTQTSDESEWSDVEDDEDDDNDDDDDGRKLKAKPCKNFVKPLKILPALDEQLGWGEYLVTRLRRVSRAITGYAEEANSEYKLGAIIKFMCLLLAPAVIWLGINYVYLKRKYKSLSGKLRKIKEENDNLKKECGKLETLLLSTEKLKMPFSTKESRQQVVAEFTRLAESRMKSKKEITQLTTEKQALLEELRMAKKQRDMARSQYSSLANGVLETSSSYVQT